MKQILEILSVKFQFLMVKFSIYLNRRVFVMLWKIKIKAMATLVGQLSLIEGLQNGPERVLKTVSFKQKVQTLIRHRVLRSLILVCTVCQCSSPSLT